MLGNQFAEPVFRFARDWNERVFSVDQRAHRSGGATLTRHAVKLPVDRNRIGYCFLCCPIIPISDHLHYLDVFLFIQQLMQTLVSLQVHGITGHAPYLDHVALGSHFL